VSQSGVRFVLTCALLLLTSSSRAALVYDEEVSGDLPFPTQSFLDIGTLSLNATTDVKGSITAVAFGPGDVDPFVFTLPAGATLTFSITVTNYQSTLGIGGFANPTFAVFLFDLSTPGPPISSAAVFGTGSANSMNAFNGGPTVGPFASNASFGAIAIPPQQQFDMGQTVNGTGGGNWTASFTTATLSAVPEAGAVAMFTLALVATGTATLLERHRRMGRAAATNNRTR